MGNISRFQQKKLASSAVGTPGVDASGQEVGASLSQSFGQVANTLFQVAQQRQQIVNETEAANAFSDYETEHLQNNAALKETFANDPRKAVADMQNNAATLARDISHTLNNPASRNMFQQLVNSRIRKSSGELNNWALTQESVNTINNYKSSFSSFSMQGSNAPDLSALENTIADITVQSDRLGNAVMGSKSPEFTQETIKETLTGFLLNQTVEDPQAAEEMLSDPLFSKHLTGEEKVELLKKIRSMGKSHREQVKLNKQIKQDDQENKADKDILFNSAMNINQKTSALRLSETREEISSEYANAAEDYLESAASLDGITDRQKLFDLFRANLNFSFANYSEKKNQERAQGFLNDIRKTKIDILEAAKSGKLNPTDTKSLLGMLSNKQAMGHISGALTKVAKGEWLTHSSLYDDMQSAVKIFENTYVDSPQDKFLATSLFFDKMMQIIETENRGIRAISPAEVQQIAGNIKDQIAAEKRQGVLLKIDRQVKEQTDVSDEALKSMMGI